MRLSPSRAHHKIALSSCGTVNSFGGSLGNASLAVSGLTFVSAGATYTEFSLMPRVSGWVPTIS
jgi:hypothetical protein